MVIILDTYTITNTIRYLRTSHQNCNKNNEKRQCIIIALRYFYYYFFLFPNRYIKNKSTRQKNTSRLLFLIFKICTNCHFRKICSLVDARNLTITHDIHYMIICSEKNKKFFKRAKFSMYGM